MAFLSTALVNGSVPNLGSPGREQSTIANTTTVHIELSIPPISPAAANLPHPTMASEMEVDSVVPGDSSE